MKLTIHTDTRRQWKVTERKQDVFETNKRVRLASFFSSLIPFYTSVYLKTSKTMYTKKNRCRNHLFHFRLIHFCVFTFQLNVVLFRERTLISGSSKMIAVVRMPLDVGMVVKCSKEIYKWCTFGNWSIANVNKWNTEVKSMRHTFWLCKSNFVNGIFFTGSRFLLFLLRARKQMVQKIYSNAEHLHI